MHVVRICCASVIRLSFVSAIQNARLLNGLFLNQQTSVTISFVRVQFMHDEYKLNDSILRVRTHTRHRRNRRSIAVLHLDDGADRELWKKDGTSRTHECETNLLQTICVMESLVNYTVPHYRRALLHRCSSQSAIRIYHFISRYNVFDVRRI